MFYIYSMKVFTSSLPEDLWEKLEREAKKLNVPKNQLIEKSLRIFLDELNRAAYVKSYKRMSDDEDTMMVAEESMTDYLRNIDDASR